MYAMSTPHHRFFWTNFRGRPNFMNFSNKGTETRNKEIKILYWTKEKTKIVNDKWTILFDCNKGTKTRNEEIKILNWTKEGTKIVNDKWMILFDCNSNILTDYNSTQITPLILFCIVK